MIQVVLFGSAGRMGTIVASSLPADDISLIAGVEKPGSPAIGQPIGVGTIIADGSPLPKCDVWVDFSLTEPALEHTRQAAKLGIPLVLATTGFTPSAVDELLKLSHHFPLLYGPNLSLGVAVFDLIAAEAARLLLPAGYDPALIDIHHSAKKDAPSGTAIRLAETVAAEGKRPEIVSLRVGGVVGEHQLIFAGKDEELVITHRAFSRSAFASGVTRAVRFIVGKRAGFYTIQDLFRVE